jgi:hypothetical protein
MVSATVILPITGQEVVNKDDFAAPARNYSPNVDAHFPNRVFWGDMRRMAAIRGIPGMSAAVPVGPTPVMPGIPRATFR